MNEDKLIQIEQALYSLADELEAKYPQTITIVDSHTHWAREQEIRREYNAIFDQAGRLLIDAFDLGGLSLRIRNFISTYGPKLEKYDHLLGFYFQWFGRKLVWNASGADLLRYYASQVRSKPVDKAAFYEQIKRRRDRYRLPEAVRIGRDEVEPYEYRSWEEALKAPERVQRLLLRGNGNTPINAEIARFHNLRLLVGYVSNRLPDEIGALGELRHLSLPGWGHIKLSPGLAQLDRLEILYLGSHIFQTLPEEITLIPNLRELTLGRVEAGKLPASIGRLRKLRSLEVSGPETLPDEIGELESLERLALEYGDLHDLSESLTRLKRLTSLNLGANKFQHFPADLLAELPKLEILVWGNHTRTPLPSPDDLVRLKSLRRIVFRASYPREELERLRALRPELIVRTW